jgi:ABC-type Zn uptake system ZnuABC Zn-binding protein ZnuA
MTKRASEDALGALHEAVATTLLAKVNSGEATAADLGAAIKFLKDNGIEAIATASNPLGKLADALPSFVDDDAEHEPHLN